MSKSNPERILLIDNGDPVFRPLTRFRSPFTMRTGIFSPLERIRLQHPHAKIYYNHPDQDYEKLVSSLEETFPAKRSSEDASHPQENKESEYHSGEIREIQFHSKDIHMFALLDEIHENINRDLPLLLATGEYSTGNASGSPGSMIQIMGDPSRLICHKSVQPPPGIVIDVRSGPVILDENAELSPFTFVQGPVYAGKGSRLDHVRIVGPTIIGHHCRVGGEIENSIINDYSNKHHEGFLGHSIVGSWVNMGALSTTSDLKNNYGEIRISIPESGIPEYINSDHAKSMKLLEIRTGRIKFGSIIGDHVKIGIGTMISTGSVIDAGANIFSTGPGRYSHPFLWGKPGQYYQPDRFIEDAKKIMARRKVSTPHPFSDLVYRIHPIKTGN